MANDELDLVPEVDTPPDWLTTTPAADTPKGNSEQGFFGDMGSAVKAGSYGLAASTGGLLEYYRRGLQNASGRPDAEGDDRASNLMKWGQEGARRAVGEMSPQSQKDVAAGVYDAAFDENVNFMNWLALNLGMSVPSLVATVAPAMLVGRAAGAVAGTAAGIGIGGGMTAGGIFEQIQSDYGKMSDEQLRKEVELYDYLRTEQGMDERQARRAVEDIVIGSKPFIMGAITGLTSIYGVEGLAAGLASGALKKGVVRNSIKGAVGEAAQETIESGAESYLTQKGNVEGKGGDIDWGKALDDAIKGGIIGGVMGAGTGAAFGRARPDTNEEAPAVEDRNKVLDPSVEAALGGAPAAVSTPPATGIPADLETPPVATPAPARPVQEVESDLDEDVDLADDTDPAIVGPEVVRDVTSTERAALATRTGNEDVPAQPTMQPEPAPVPPVAEAPAVPSEAVQTAPEPVPAPVPEEAPAAAPPAAPAAPVPTAPVAVSEAGAAPQTPRVLQSQTPEAQQSEIDLAKLWKGRGAATRAEMRESGELERRERIRATDIVSADAISKLPRKSWIAAARRIAERDGDSAPQQVRTAVELADNRDTGGFGPRSEERAKLNSMIDEMQRETAKLYEAIESERRAKAAEGFDTTRDAVASGVEGKGAKVRRAIKERAEKSSDGAQRAVQNTDADLQEVHPDPKERAKALATRLGNIIVAAEESGVVVPTSIKEGTPLYQRVLKVYRDHLRRLNARRYPKGYDSFADYVNDVMADELLARSGSATEVADRFRVEGSSLGSPEGLEAADAVANDIADTSGFGLDEDDSSPVREPVDRPSTAPKSNEGAVQGGVTKPVAVEVKRRRPAIPTKAQAEAGNYAKVKKPFGQHIVTVETAKGQTRSGTASDGTEWSVKMPADYGYIKRTKGADGEQIDVFLGPAKTTTAAPVVFVINQKDPATNKFDEHKVMLGFPDEQSAMQAYYDAFSDGSGPMRVQSVDVMTNSEFNDWVKQPQTKPAEGEVLLAAPDTQEAPTRTYDRYIGSEEELRSASTRVTNVGNSLAASLLRSQGRANEIARAITDTLRREAGNVPVYYMDADEFMRVPGVADFMYRNGNMPAGVYHPLFESIIINNASTRMGGDPTQEHALLVHEALHAALSNVINNHAGARAKVGRMLAIAKQAAEGTGDVFQYGLTNEHEFISEAMMNPSFQEFLSRVHTGNPAQVTETLWGQLIQFVRRALRFPNAVPDSLLEHAIRTTQQLFEVAGNTRMGNAPMRGAMPLMSVGDHVKATGTWMRRAGYALSTLHYIGTNNRGLFTDTEGDALADTINQMERLVPRSRELQKESQKLAIDFINHGAKNPNEAAAMADIAIDATMMNVNLLDDPNWTPASLLAANTHLGKDAARGWQAKAYLNDLQRQFMKLSPEGRKVWKAQTEYYRATQNKVTRAALVNVLDSFRNKLTQAQIDALVTKTMAGTLDDTDATLLGNGAIFNNLKNSLALRGIDGTYFPLMRFGNHVVQTRLKAGDLMGGTMVGHNIVEFRAQDNKTARDMARKFAGSTDMPVTSTKRRYIERATGKVLSADNAKGQIVDYVYRVQVQRDGVFMFDSAADAHRFIREQGDQFDQVSGVQPKADYATDNTLNAAQLGSLMGAIRNMDDASMSPARKLEMEQALHQVAARLLPGNRIQQRNIKRKNVVGASHDLTRSLLAYGQASSGYLARSEYMPRIRDAMGRMRKIMADKTVISSHAAQRSVVYNELQKRFSGNVETVYEPNRLVQDMMTLSFMDKLMSPAYSIINAMQVQMVTYPYLAGAYGAAAAQLQLAKAYNAVGMGSITLDGLRNTKASIGGFAKAAIDTRDIVGSIKKRLAGEKDGAQLISMLDELQARGALDDGALFEIASAVEGGRGVVGTGLARVDRVARQLPAAVEQLNRTVAAISTYRLATQRGNTHAQAMDRALDVVKMTQFDYSNTNSSRIFNSGLAKLTLQFKKYAASMAVLLYDMTKRAFKGATLPERQAGRKALANLFLVQIAAAGALSLPGLELIKVFTLVAGLLGVGGGYDDVERWLRHKAKEVMGEKTAEAMLRGLPRLIGLDISSRVSLADMFLFGEPKTLDQEGWQAYAWRLIAGAPASYGADLISAANDFGKGDIAKGVEKIIPVKLIADTLKASREYREGNYGATNPTALARAGTQAIGIRPASSARRSEDIGDSIAKRNEKANERKEIERRYLRATPNERGKMLKEITRYNNSEGVTFRTKISVGALNRRAKADADKRAGRPNKDNREY